MACVVGGAGGACHVQGACFVLVRPRGPKQCDFQDAQVPQHAGGHARCGHALADRSELALVLFCARAVWMSCPSCGAFWLAI